MEVRELSTFYNIPVFTYDRDAPPTEISISVLPAEEGVLAGEVLHKACCRLGVLEDNIKCFSLVDERLCPKRRYRAEDTLIPPFPDLCIKKWTFTADSERHLVDDPAALHLLYLEARSDISSGRIKPTKEQLEKLEEYLDPGFCLENQYVLLCHDIDLYWTVTFRDVKVCKYSEDQNSNLFFSEKSSIDLYITYLGLNIKQGGKSGIIPWRLIRTWTAHRNTRQIEFDVTCRSGAPWRLELETQQLQYILATISEILKFQQTEDSLFYTSMINVDKDKNQISWENALYDPTPQSHSDGHCSADEGYGNPEGCIDLTQS